MFSKLRFNNLVITNKQKINQCRIQTMHKLVHKIRKLKSVLEKWPENAKNKERLRKSTECVQQLKSLKRVDIMKRILILEKSPITILSEGRATPDEVVIAMLAMNKVMQALLLRFREELDLDSADKAWRIELMEASKKQAKKMQLEDKRRKRIESKAQKVLERKRLEWLEENKPESEEISPNKDPSGATVYQSPSGIWKEEIILKKEGEDKIPTLQNSNETLILQNSNETSILQNSIKIPALQNSTETPTLQNAINTPTLQNSNKTPTLQYSNKNPSLENAVKTPAQPNANKTSTLQNASKTPAKIAIKNQKIGKANIQIPKANEIKTVENKDIEISNAIEQICFKEQLIESEAEEEHSEETEPEEEHSEESVAEEDHPEESEAEKIKAKEKFGAIKVKSELVESDPGESEEEPEVTHVIDPFFITESGENYLSTAVIKQNHQHPPAEDNIAKPRFDSYQPKYERAANSYKSGHTQNNRQKLSTANSQFRKPRNETENLHPSWAAKQKLKPIITNFQGKKIRFNDDAQPQYDEGNYKNNSVGTKTAAQQSVKSENLHPSWVAKQKLKPTIATFLGNKIKFADDDDA